MIINILSFAVRRVNALIEEKPLNNVQIREIRGNNFLLDKKDMSTKKYSYTI
jgi:hypothetical protein